MNRYRIHFAPFALLTAFLFCSTCPAEVVYDNTTTSVLYYMATSEAGDTVTLSGSERFINRFTLGIGVYSGDFNETSDFRLFFYLPDAPNDSPGTLIWQSPPLTDIVLNEAIQLVTFDVPHIRVPETFIWSVEDAGSISYLLAGSPTVGSSPNYGWTNLDKFDAFTTNFMCKIEATSRPDAILLGTIYHNETSAISDEERNSIRLSIYVSGMRDVKGPKVAGLRNQDSGTFRTLLAKDYPHFVEFLTNGQNDTIYYFSECVGNSGTEQSFINKSPGIAPDYPDFFGCAITDITMAVHDINVEHITPGWTDFTVQVTWEFWGRVIPADLNKNGMVDFKDLCLLAGDWGNSGAGLPGDISGPTGEPDGSVNSHDLDMFADYWLKNVDHPEEW